MRQKRLPVRIVRLRKKLCYEAWEKNKGSYSMEDLALAFRMSLSQFYETVRDYGRKSK